MGENKSEEIRLSKGSEQRGVLEASGFAGDEWMMWNPDQKVHHNASII